MAVLTLAVMAGSVAYWAIGLWPVLPTATDAAAFATGILFRPHDHAGAWLLVMIVMLAWFAPGRDEYPARTGPGALWCAGALAWMMGLGAVSWTILNGDGLAIVAGGIAAVTLGLIAQRIDLRGRWLAADR